MADRIAQYGRMGSAPRGMAEAVGTLRAAFMGVGLLSGVINVLYLAGSFFMLEVYDRVLPSHSVPTLVGLLVIVGVLYAFQGLLEILRGRILVRLGTATDEALNGRAFAATVRLPFIAGGGGLGQQPIRDLDAVRSFLGGAGPSALFDLPWMPIYLAICFAFHPWIGTTALAGAILLVVLTLVTHRLTTEPTKRAMLAGQQRDGIAGAGVRNAEVIRAMGMSGRVGGRWAAENAAYIASQQQAADISAGLGAASKVSRLALQSGVLAVGAYLVIAGEATGGIIIASSILTSRALAPVELAIAHWKGLVQARLSWRRLRGVLQAVEAGVAPMALPPPASSLLLENVSAAPAGSTRPVVFDVSLSLGAGSALGIIGPSGSGKSSLARVMVGVWPVLRGAVRLDGATLQQWDPEALGRHVGYLPQDVELFAGTVAENIARFDPAAAPEAVIAAARTAGCHDLILRLPDGYETELGEGGSVLSAGQRQRVALARALYGDPFLVVLDEPNSNLDAEGEAALTEAIRAVRARRGIAVIVAHRPSAIAAADFVLMLVEGRVQGFGAKDEVLQRVLRPAQVAGPGLRLAPGGGA